MAGRVVRVEAEHIVVIGSCWKKRRTEKENIEEKKTDKPKGCALHVNFATIVCRE
jgi:hypothetical protein